MPPVRRPRTPARARLPRRHSVRLGLAAGVVVALGLVVLATPLGAAPLIGTLTSSSPPSATSATSTRPARPARPAPPIPIDARLRLHGAAATPRIPPSFLGISTEYWALPRWARHLTGLDRVLSLLRGPGPLTLRIGGTSADWAVWGSRRRDPPDWEFELTPAWLHEVRTIVDHTHARVILDLNTVTATPAVAARWARRFAADLPHGRLLGFEIGNEPDLYGPSVFPEAIERSRAALRLPRAISAVQYADSFAAFATALSAAAPHVPLLGPALADPDIGRGFLTRLLSAPHPGLAEITVHRYPYSACVRPSSRDWPTLPRILSASATTGMARSLRGALRVARRAGLPLRLTELNSVTCGGVRGVSDAFATALWAPDALFSLVHAGVVAAAVHIRADAINAAFVLNHRGLYARPLLYGLILFHRMLGADPHLVALHLSAPARLNLSAWAVRSGATLRVLVLDKGTRPAGVALALPGRGAASVQRLLAPSVASTGDVTLAGQHLGRDGLWQGTPVTAWLARGRGGYRLWLPAGSAAMVTVALGHPRR